MFTGIIQAIGKVVKYDGKRLWISTPLRGIGIGESVGVDGVCLTVCARRKQTLAFDVGLQTQRVTTLGRVHPGSAVNLERALRFGDPLGGHWVSGHVEQTGTIVKVEKGRKSWWFTFEVPPVVRRYVVSRGSLAIDGISLTTAIVKGNWIKIMIIPHTLKRTTLGQKKTGDLVNLEPDLIAKYAFAHRSAPSAAKALRRFLRQRIPRKTRG
jgi:riboflavin synthase alpha subunit